MILESIHCKLQTQTYTGLAEQPPEFVAEQRRMDGLIMLNARRVRRNQNYASLLCVLIFFFCFASMILVQRQSSIVYSAVKPLHEMLFGDLNSESLTITGPSEIYILLENFAGVLLRDSQCGDGICDQNEYEYQGFGRFGCQEDCGKYSKTTLITVHLQDFLQGSVKYGGWDLSKISKSVSPEYKWNVFSHTMGAYILENHKSVTGFRETVEVPDGKFELRLFQTRQVHDVVDAVSVYKALKLVPTTLMERAADISDFSYGDAREAMAAATIVVQDVKEHCWIGDPTKYDPKCMEYPALDTLFKALGSYGVAGTVTMTKPGEKSPVTLASVSHCAFLPAGLQGVANATNKAAMKKSDQRCSDSARRQELRDDNEKNTSSPVLKERRLLQLAGRGAGCVWHDGCAQDVTDPITGNAGQFCAKGGYCEVCSFCQSDAEDSVDSVCPLSYCQVHTHSRARTHTHTIHTKKANLLSFSR
jgi:hypothetical protein